MSIIKTSNNKKIILKRILRIIKENDLTLKDFADSCSLSPGNVTDWKNNRVSPSLDALRKISKAYNVQLEWLTGDSKYRTKQEEFCCLKEREGANERFNKN